MSFIALLLCWQHILSFQFIIKIIWINLTAYRILILLLMYLKNVILLPFVLLLLLMRNQSYHYNWLLSMFVFSLMIDFRIFSLSSVLSNWTTMCLGLPFWATRIYGLIILSHLGKISSIIFLDNFLSNLSLLSYVTAIATVSLFDILPYHCWFFTLLIW